MYWKKLELSSREEINFFLKNRFEESDLNFTNLYLWSFSENIEYLIEDNTLFIRGVYRGKTYYFPPISPEKDKLKIGFEKILKESQEIIFIPEEIAKQLDKSLLVETRDSFDYIYLQKDLSTLSGRKFSSKKNKVNKFTRNYQYSYEKITTENIEEVKEFQKRWIEDRESEEIVEAEMLGVEKILENYEQLDLRGGLIRVDGKVIAYAIGEKIKEDMGVIHIEKADVVYTGAYQVINMLVAKNEFSDVKFINREDDFGDEGLRTAKLSYQPERLLKKYRVMEGEKRDV